MRTFVAVEISDDNTLKSIEKAQLDIEINAKPVAAKNLHFTLQFLGEISEERAEKISSALRKIEFSSFDLTLRGIDSFPNPKNPRVVWIGTDKRGGDLLIELSKKVEGALKPLGLLSDKPFKPHITIFRIKKRKEDIRKQLEERNNIDFGIQRVSSIKLKKSQLTPNGPVYSDLEEFEAIN